MLIDENFVPLTPISYFQIQTDCFYLADDFPGLSLRNFHRFALPKTAAISNEEGFADIAMSWNEEGVEFLFNVKKPLEFSSFPDLKKGDSIEIFLDTRDIKTSGYNTRFCHHFFFLPEPGEDQATAGELTCFRTEDAHELCDPNLLTIRCEARINGYIANLLIPKEALNGYDPEQFDRLGFTYRINRVNGAAQHFSVTSDDYPIEQQPSLWGSIKLKK